MRRQRQLRNYNLVIFLVFFFLQTNPVTARCPQYRQSDGLFTLFYSTTTTTTTRFTIIIYGGTRGFITFNAVVSTLAVWQITRHSIRLPRNIANLKPSSGGGRTGAAAVGGRRGQVGNFRNAAIPAEFYRYPGRRENIKLPRVREKYK